ncbi:Cof-type HAD-IIB family hydrolase [Clostridium brassicae]|uniref:Cof-type HAD-IIB family hydrolase n=1 Tax=Clostridium brassicae TaxID=2999072 RepID=A0ABT4D9I6_9CLOT|nr:Cof-type HAD-IIB family hydrolase [Clostridium brassicae]MCY6958961.1 Cof-type HAD-IIB family hydrolase [Clostridium brassicae]
MGYKLICLDMDGTVLDDKKKISHRNKEAIKRAHDKGVKIAISTGRVFASARYYAEILGIKAPIIASNGAYIREKDKDEVIYESLLDKEVCKNICHIIEKYDFFNYFNTYNRIIANKPFPKQNIYRLMNEELPNNMKISLDVVSDIKEILEDDSNRIVKFISISDDYENLNKAREEIDALGGLEIVRSNINNFEVMNKGCSKGSAVERLSEFYGIKKDEVICIGDSENDLSMIKYAGMGIAMGNGEDYIKSNAKYVTDTNNNDGVAKAIEKFVL